LCFFFFVLIACFTIILFPIFNTECLHVPYDPDADGIGTCWMMPLGDRMNEWQNSRDFCTRYDVDAHLIELDTLAKMNYFIQHSGLLNNVTLVLTKTTFSII
jgi:hypothetical protein